MYRHLNQNLTLADALAEYHTAAVVLPRYRASIRYHTRTWYCTVGEADTKAGAVDILLCEQSDDAMEGKVTDTWTDNDVEHIEFQTRQQYAEARAKASAQCSFLYSFIDNPENTAGG
jgi:hypothetical protein